jgi:tetratricopeptide (TPR) repeat protein
MLQPSPGGIPERAEGPRRRPPILAAAILLVLTGAVGCASTRIPELSEPARRIAAEAARTSSAPIAFEDDFLEARLVYQALPLTSAERPALRERMVHYLLEPLTHLEAEKLRKESRELGDEDIYDRVAQSFRDSLSLFDPSELWEKKPRFSDTEARLLAASAHLVIGLLAPRGNDAPLGLAFAVLATVEPQNAEWPKELAHLLDWTDESARAVEGTSFRRPISRVEVLQAGVERWPAPILVDQLGAAYRDRQKKFAGLFRGPAPSSEDARRALGELLMSQGEEMQHAAALVASLYLRCGLVARARDEAGALAGQPGDDPDLRQLLAAAARRDATAADFARLARRFLPPGDALGGTSAREIDPTAAARVVEVGLGREPGDATLLQLSSRLARALGAPFLALRRQEELKQLLEKAGPVPAEVDEDLLELAFVRLRLHLDPERPTPAFAEADRVRALVAALRRRQPPVEPKIGDADIDYEVGRSYLNTGHADEAERLFLKAQHEETPGEPHAEALVELGTLAIKRGDPRRAAALVKEGLARFEEAHRGRDTIGSVEGAARLRRTLGDAYDSAGDHEQAGQAWRESLAAWERLMLEHLRRKNFGSSAEATVEVGRLLYELGRHSEGVQKMLEAVDQEEDRDQTYIEGISFLVQNGELDGALALYRRALSRSDSVVSEYVKVYASLWIYDVTRRASHIPDAAAERFLKSLDERHPEIRPRRSAGWYRSLAGFIVGKVGYETLAAEAQGDGRKAELFFYEAMRKLGDGATEAAHQLLQKVVDTKMYSFFEYDMAARYLRKGAPTSPPRESDRATNSESI